MKKQHYLAALPERSADSVENGVVVRSLVFVEGRQKPVKGRASVKTPEMLQAYAQNTNGWIDSGRSVPFFISPHDAGADGYSVEKQIGRLEQFSASPITAADIKDTRFSDLIGKTGVFANVHIVRDDAVEKYSKGLIKEISVGIGDMGEGNGPQFYEASVVPWGAVRGAMVYGHSVAADDDAEDEADEKEIFALTLEGAIAEREARYSPVRSELEELTETFARVIQNIQATTEAELLGRNRQQLMAEAVDALSTKLRERLALTALAPIPSGDTFMKFQYSGKPLEGIVSELKAGEGAAKEAAADLAKELGVTTEVFAAALTPKSAEQAETYGAIVGAIAKRMDGAEAETNALTPDIEQRFAKMQGQIEQFAGRAQAAESKLAAMEKRQQVGDRYMLLKDKAAQLNAAGKLSAAAYRAYFPEGEQFATAVERFSAAPTAEGEAQTTLDEIEASLSYVEKFGTAIKTGSVAGRDAVINKQSEVSEEEKADLERFMTSQGITGEERERYLKKVGAA